MGYSSLATYKNLTSNKSTRKSNVLDNIVIHCYVGQVTAKQGCDYFATTSRQVSANYVVGYDGSIGVSVDEKYRAWTTGYQDKNGNTIRRNGISGADMDHRAVTIEVACESYAPYKITDKAYKALINLCADICKRNGIKELKWQGDKAYVGKLDKQNLAVHRWFAPTECPGDYIFSKMGDLAKQVNAKLKPATTTTTTNKTNTSTTTKAKFAKGDVVKVTKAVTYEGKSFKLYYDKYTVLEVKGDRVVIGVNGVITAPVKDTNLTKVTATTTKEIKVGSTVKVKKNAKTYDGKALASFVYNRKHKVSQIDGYRVVITYDGQTVAAVNKSDLTLV